MKIRQVIAEPGARDGEPARGVQAEEPDAGIAAVAVHVGAQVELVKCSARPGSPSRAVRDSGMVNGTRPRYATPSKVSTVSPGGSSGAIAALATGQCRKPRWRQT